MDLRFNKLNDFEKLKPIFVNKKFLRVMSFLGNPLCQS